MLFDYTVNYRRGIKVMAHYDDGYGNSSKNSGKNKMPKRNKRVDDYKKSKQKKDNGYYRPMDS